MHPYQQQPQYSSSAPSTNNNLSAYGLNASLLDDSFQSLFAPTTQHQQQASSMTSNHVSNMHPAYGLQQPQPLKLSNNNNQINNYEAPKNTFQSFNTSAHFVDNIRSSAVQSGAIRGRVASPHVYQYDLQPVEQESKKDFSIDAGMKINTPSYNSAPNMITMDPFSMIRQAVADVYQGAMMMKTHAFNNFSVFKCPVENMTSGNFKYIVAIVPNYEFVPLGTSFSLQSLPWISFQTRSTDNPNKEFGEHRPPSIVYKIPYERRHSIYDRINLRSETDQSFVYVADTLPCQIQVLKLKPGDTSAQSATIMTALEGFKTIITLMN